MTAATAATAAATAAADTAAAAADGAAEVVERVIDNSAKTLAFVALVVGGALGVAWLTRRFGESAMDAAEQRGLLDPPMMFVPADPDDTADQDDDEDEGDPRQAETGDGSWAR